MPKLDWRELAAIFAGGFLGALARVLLVQLAPVTPGSWPWATFVANLAGSLLLGYFVTRLQERLPVSAYRRPLLAPACAGRSPPSRRCSWSCCGCSATAAPASRSPTW
jgi:CrcB protein